MFRDKIYVKTQAGKGGDGAVNFDNMRRPTGGNGGKGGSVVFVGDNNLYSLSKLKKDKLYKAEDGEPGGRTQMTGADGEDIEIRVPIKTVIYDDFDNKIGSVEKHGQRVTLLEGGEGGLGNHFFRKGRWKTLDKHTLGEKPDVKRLELQLELQSDVIFIGYPNAGKSSIVSEVTNAEAKAASYAFTTLVPQLGRVEDMTLMDLPGLIEGTHEGKGLGTRFLKHTKAAQLIAHTVSFEYFDGTYTDIDENGKEGMLLAYKSMREELKAIDEDLWNKDEVVLLTKADVVEPETRTEVKQFFEEETGKEVFIVSLYDADSLETLPLFLKENLS